MLVSTRAPAPRDDEGGLTMADTTPAIRSDWPDLFERLLPRDVSDWWRHALSETDFRVEEYTENDTRVIEAELPGLDPERDLDVTAERGMLRTRAERRHEEKSEEKGQYRSEYRYGSFLRTVPLPAGATVDDVKATYRDGVLEVRVPLDHRAAESERIPISRG